MKYERKWNSADDSGVKECCSAQEDTKNKVMGRAVKERAVLAEHRGTERGIVGRALHCSLIIIRILDQFPIHDVLMEML